MKDTVEKDNGGISLRLGLGSETYKVCWGKENWKYKGSIEADMKDTSKAKTL